MELAQLQHQLTEVVQREDWQAARALRQQLVADYPDSGEAAEAAYRLGLDALFFGRDLVAAVQLLEDAAKRNHPFWAAAARTSLALCYAQQNRGQKALFELRKVAATKPPGANSVVALMWMERLLLQDGNAPEAEKARSQRIDQLRSLLSPATQPPLALSERGSYLYQLGCALSDHGERLEGRRILEEARALGPQILGADVARGVAEALRG